MEHQAAAGAPEKPKNTKKMAPTVAEILALAEGKSQLWPRVEREGLVFRTPERQRISFKAIFNRFLVGEKD